jgi:hypothetical protein
MQKSPQPNKFTLSYHVSTYHIFYGKVIGYLDDLQFAAVIKDPKRMSRKLSTMIEKHFFDLISPAEAEGSRLVFLSEEDFSTKSNIRRLVISSKITELSSSLACGHGEINMVGSDGNEFCLEVEVD